MYGLLSRGSLGPLGQQRSPREVLTLPQNPRQAPFSMSALGCAEEEVDKHSCKLQTQKTDLKNAPQSKSKQVRRAGSVWLHQQGPGHSTSCGPQALTSASQIFGLSWKWTWNFMRILCKFHMTLSWDRRPLTWSKHNFQQSRTSQGLGGFADTLFAGEREHVGLPIGLQAMS